MHYQFKSKAYVKALPQEEQDAIRNTILQDRTSINTIPPIPVKAGKTPPLKILYRFTDKIYPEHPRAGVFFNKEDSIAVSTNRYTLAITPMEDIKESITLTEQGTPITGLFPNYTLITKHKNLLTSCDAIQLAPMLGKLKAVSNVWDVLFPDDKYYPYIAVYKDIQIQGFRLQRILQALSDAGNTTAIIHYNDPYNPVRFETGNMEIWTMPILPVSRGDAKRAFLDL